MNMLGTLDEAKPRGRTGSVTRSVTMRHAQCLTGCGGSAVFARMDRQNQ